MNTYTVPPTEHKQKPWRTRRAADWGLSRTEAVECPPLNRTSVPYPLHPQVPGRLQQRQKNCKSQTSGQRWNRNFWTWRLWAHKQASQCSSTDRERAHVPTPVHEEPQAGTGCWGRESEFSSVGWAMVVAHVPMNDIFTQGHMGSTSVS